MAAAPARVSCQFITTHNCSHLGVCASKLQSSFFHAPSAVHQPRHDTDNPLDKGHSSSCSSMQHTGSHSACCNHTLPKQMLPDKTAHEKQFHGQYLFGEGMVVKLCWDNMTSALGGCGCDGKSVQPQLDCASAAAAHSPQQILVH